MQTKIYNLIILDESGSMSLVLRQTINGCNETINTIKSSQSQFADTQQHFISIYAFQGNVSVPSRYLAKNIPVLEARHISNDDYRPWGSTPLYDAVGSTLADLKSIVLTQENAIGSVTIITDGEENSSTHYSLSKVARMIKELKELGWNFNFIGANIDVKAYANSLNIDNCLEFKQDEEGTRRMFEKERSSRLAYNKRLNDLMNEEVNYSFSPEERKVRLSNASKGYFDE